MPAYECSGWRDEALSRRHREWGHAVAAADVDYLMVEYAAWRIRALIEFKHEASRVRKLQDASAGVRILAALGDLARLPTFMAVYWPETYAVRLWPLNSSARRWLDEPSDVSEYEFVRLLYRLRGLEDEFYAAVVTVGPLTGRRVVDILHREMPPVEVPA